LNASNLEKQTMHDIPVFYATSEGQTRRIAERIAATLREAGFTSAAVDLGKDEGQPIDWQQVRGVVVGASLHGGRHQRPAVRFVSSHRHELNARPSAFFSVSLSAASHDTAELNAARELAQRCVASSGWRPQRLTCLAGALAYSQYGFVKRIIMRLIAGRHSAPTDTSRDYELTDWEAVRRFALDVAADVRASVRDSGPPARTERPVKVAV
jgi:menaquinone-dependent protoporphyrinogen oxidase